MLAKMIRKLVDNPYLNLLVGIVLISSSFMEVWESFQGDTIKLDTSRGNAVWHGSDFEGPPGHHG